MKINYLFPQKYKKIAWFIFVPTLIIGVYSIFFDFEPSIFDYKVFGFHNKGLFSDKFIFDITDNNLWNEFLGILLIISGLIVAFSKEKIEDEYIQKIRLKSLVWATYINYIFLLFAIIFVYDFSFLYVMIFNIFTPLIFFIIRFNWVVFKTSKQVKHEE